MKLMEVSYLHKLRNFKKIFGVGILTSSLLVIWSARKNKLKKLNAALEDCDRLPLDEKLFKCNVDLYRKRNYVFPGPIVTSGVIEKIPSFELRDDDIIVASFPKSGTTWVQEIVYMLTHDFEESTDNSEILETRFPYLEYPYPGLKTIANTKGRRFIKTHLPFTLLPSSLSAKDTKLIYVIRNPRDTAVSYWYFMKLLSTVSFIGSFKEFVNLFISDKIPYGPYFEHVSSYYKERGSKNICIVYYEDMKKNPIQVIKSLADFLQVPVTDEDILKVSAATTFSRMSENKSVNYEHWKDIGFANNNEGKFMRKGQIGDWKNHFDSETLTIFERWEQSNASFETPKFNYEF